MSLVTIALSHTLADKTWVDVSNGELKIHASRRWLAPLLSEYQHTLSADIHYPMQQLEPSLLHLALLLHKEASHSRSETSAYSLEIARVLSIHLLRTRF